MFESPRTVYSVFAKRFFDIILSLVSLIATLPLSMLICITIRIDSPGFPIFRQVRIGYKCKEFEIYKFRTMTERSHDEQGRKIRDRYRLTRVGKILRRLSLDEIPQLFCILKGDMSFIGPRPLHERYLPYYTPDELHRHGVRPGVTGLAQVNGRSDLQWEKRFEYDLYYVKNLSFCLDFRILMLTLAKAFKGENTSTVRPDDLMDFDLYRQQLRE